jgi:hypothetical protein
MVSQPQQFHQTLKEVVEHALNTGGSPVGEMRTIFKHDYPGLYASFAEDLADKGLDVRIRQLIRSMTVPSHLQMAGQIALPGLPPPGSILIPQDAGSEEVVKLYSRTTVMEHRRYVDKLWAQVEQDRLRAQDEEAKHLFYLERIAQLNLTTDAEIADLL